MSLFNLGNSDKLFNLDANSISRWLKPINAFKKAGAFTCALSTTLFFSVASFCVIHNPTYADINFSETTEDVSTKTLVYPALKWFAPYPIGVQVNSNKVLSELHTKTLNHSFDQITAGWEMTMEHLSEGPNQFQWDAADTLIQFANQQGLGVHSQSLIWHHSIPDWVKQFPGTDAEFELAIKHYVQSVVSHYKDSVTSWDVINEVFDDEGNWINNIFLERMGQDYVAKLFQWAHEADPDALLFLNDYLGAQSKNTSLLNLIDELLAQNTPLHGVGIQMHIIPEIWNHDFNNFTFVEAFFDQLATRHLLVHLSELDVIMNWEGKKTELSKEQAFNQKSWYKAAVSAFNHLPQQHQYAITLWSLSDEDNWVNWTYEWEDWPAVMDEKLSPKPGYYGVLEALIEDYGWPE